jgi:hypothetical protein
MSVSGEGGNKRRNVARVLAGKLPVEQPRNDPEFTFGGSGIEKTVIRTQTALEAVVEQQIDIHLGGLDQLFTQKQDAKAPTSTNDWGDLVNSYMAKAYVLQGLDINAVRTAVRAVKDKHRVQALSNMANNLQYRGNKKAPYIAPYSVDDLKDKLRKEGAFLEPPDDAVLEKIFNGTVGQEDDFSAGWIEEAGQIQPGSDEGREDLVTLIAQCSGNLYSTQIGTVVGGIAISGNAKRVQGLHDTSARIDRQNPPPDAFNIQYQAGGQSHACVIFHQSDPSNVVLDKLLESFDSGMQLRSPRVPVRS